MLIPVPGCRLLPSRVLALSFGLLACFLSVHPAAAREDAPEAEIISLYGQGDYREDAGAAWRGARVQQGLEGGNYVRTGAYSRLGLLFRDRTQLRLNEKTILQIREVSTPDSGSTRLRLERGRAWTRANLLPRGLEMDTPAATAAIRGTDWELEVAEDGTATVTVLSGEVRFFNPLGEVTVGSGEQARAAPGSPPVKIIVVRPRDRVQWVTAYPIEPWRHLDSEDPGALADAITFIEREDLAAAVAELDPEVAAGNQAAVLIRSDIFIFRGELDEARRLLESALTKAGESPRLLSQRARVELLAGELQQAQTWAARAVASDANAVEAWLATGEVARIAGDAINARQAFTQAAEIAPEDDRPWYGLGVVSSEREEVRRAERYFDRALALNETGAGYRGALATLDSFAWRLEAADTGFAQALEQNPGDVTALAGQGVNWLKRGDIDRGLDSLLRAQTLEPRYTRAHLYAGVAHYQAGRRDQALEELSRVKELDPLDPTPWLLESVIRTDFLQPAEAVAASREALVRMPNLKSLNQIANDRRGSANVGRAFAFWGLEEWARSYAQESYYPFWAGSHLFLADRYNGRFNKNSELFQGFLSDPLAFGASNRFNTLMKRPGNYLSSSMRYSESDDVDGTTPFIQVNGLNWNGVPTAYFLGYSRFDLDFDGDDRETEHATVGFGFQPRHDISVFLFADSNDLDDETVFEDPFFALDTEQDLSTDRIDLGTHIKFTPRAQLWLKAGHFDSNDRVEGSLAVAGGPDQALSVDEDIDQPDVSGRFTFEVTEGHDVSLGVEYVDRDTDSLGLLAIAELSFLGVDSQFDERFRESSLELYLADRFNVNTNLLLHGEVGYQDQDREKTLVEAIVFPGFPPIEFEPERSDRSRSGWYYRAGAVYRFAPERLIRAAYQSWMRPLSFSTLGDVATAGIPLDDRLVAPGGELDRGILQLEWALGSRSFMTAHVDYREIDSNRFDFRALDFVSKREVESLQNLQQRDRGSLARDDMLEFVSVPEFSEGEILEAGATFNRILSREWSAYARYIYRDTENTGQEFRDNELPYLPEDTVAFGATWVRPNGWYLASRLIYRSDRYTDEANLSERESGWNFAADLYWESIDKQWLLRFSVDDAFDEDLETLYTGEINLRL